MPLVRRGCEPSEEAMISCRALRLTRKGDRLAVVLKLSRYAAKNPRIWRVKGTEVK